MLNDDYKEMLQCLSEEDVKFLLVGAYALAVHGFPRATKDIDFFVWATPENAAKLMQALAKFGAPMTEISESDFSSEGVIFQIGNSPRRIDIITTIDGIKFDQAYANRKIFRSDCQQARERTHTGSGRRREAGVAAEGKAEVSSRKIAMLTPDERQPVPSDHQLAAKC